ncbi:glycosyltransferase family A protein [Granulicella sp. S190]|uniref:glycosyltransferase family 2 protein n=1 Tax=Granulicella sp. S190 TaxID=1747226 RepID=UPI00131CCEE8|nr:glycosyltransferase family A protein [Granulicella sp. S190]
MPKVDVIIPAYNAAKYLPIAIESVEAQTFDDWRILLVDDGSTDNTAAVVAPYAERLGPKLKYIHQANKGLPGARNTAIRNSSAEFLALLDADDVWFPCRLKETLKIFEAHPKAGLVYGFTTLIDPEGKVTAVFDRRQKNGEGAVAPYIYMRKIDLPCPTVTFRRECVDEVGLFDETLRATEDRDLWLRIALRYEVAVVPTLIAHYRTSPGSMSTDPERMLQAQLQFIEKHYGAPGCGPKERKIALSQVYKQHAVALGAKRRPWAGLMSSLRAFAIYPLDKGNVRTTGSLLLQCVGLGTSSS